MERDLFGKFQEFDYLIKIVLIGDAAVGKSSLLLKYIDDIFEDNYISTIGVDFKMKSLTLNNKRIKLQVWDTAGQERFKPITKCYFRGSHGCVVLYDIANKSSFLNVRTWINDYREDNVVDSANNIVIVANKSDKEESRQVTVEEGKSLAEAMNVKFVEASAKTGEGVREAFEEIAQVVVDNMRHEFLVAKPKELMLSKPLEETENSKKKNCCLR